MSEQYRFMRYYLPSSLFLIYVMILTIPNLSAETLKFLSQQAIIGIFTGAFVASPIIGYLIYAFYNCLYEYLAGKRTLRPALRYIEDLTFVNDNKRARYKEKLKCFIQKKEFLDLIYHSTLEKNGEIKIDREILGTLKNHLSAFAARVVCGLFVPLLCIPSYFILRQVLSFFGVNFTSSSPLLITSIVIIIILSGVLLWDCQRVLYEAYQLEAYLIKVKKKEIIKLLEKLFTSENNTLTEKGVHENSC